VGAIIFNQGNTPDRTGLIGGTLGPENASGIPVMDATYDLGVSLMNTPGLTMRLFTNVFRGLAETANVFAETRSGNDNNVVMVGAHLDSVDTGPGINDNGSGVAAILETAQQMAKVNPRNTVRFALWGAEEAGLVGSTYYVLGLSDEERARIAMYLNFDMIGSPNYVRFVYDGNGSAFGLAGPPGSGPIESYFTNFYANRGLESEPTEISFRSDYAAFFDSGIPFGGLFTGAEGVKTAAQAATFGGTAGQAYDPCYHQACDTFANSNNEVLDLNSDAVAASTLKFAMSTQSVNGVKGKGNFQAPAHDEGVLPTS
jgi:aminopeptidase Y